MGAWVSLQERSLLSLCKQYFNLPKANELLLFNDRPKFGLSPISNTIYGPACIAFHCSHSIHAGPCQTLTRHLHGTKPLNRQCCSLVSRNITSQVRDTTCQAPQGQGTTVLQIQQRQQWLSHRTLTILNHWPKLLKIVKASLLPLTTHTGWMDPCWIEKLRVSLSLT